MRDPPMVSGGATAQADRKGSADCRENGEDFRVCKHNLNGFECVKEFFFLQNHNCTVVATGLAGGS
jgi:hypothetical protein